MTKMKMRPKCRDENCISAKNKRERERERVDSQVLDFGVGGKNRSMVHYI